MPELEQDPSLQAAVAEPEPADSTVAAVAAWLGRIKDAKDHWDDDFKRMREDMKFASGRQWIGQTKMQDEGERYVVNLVLRTVNQKVATLYARDPRAIARRRKRLDYELWDGTNESLMAAYENVQAGFLQQAPPSVESQLLLMDYMRGQKERAFIDKVCRTLEIVYQHQVDAQEPEFKLQMKQLVRRVVTCGVGFVRMGFERQSDMLESSGTDVSLQERAQRAATIVAKLVEGEIDESSPEIETLRSLVLGLRQGAATEAGELHERLVLDFPPSTSVVIDPACRVLKGFVGADWIALEHFMTLDKVNAWFGTSLTSSDLDTFDRAGNSFVADAKHKEGNQHVATRYCKVYEIFDKITQTSLFVTEGYEDYLQAPGPVNPRIKRFWPLFPITFNDLETEGFDENEDPVSIYPPSDVQLMRHPQKEWNRSRDAKREHRKANAPGYVTPAGTLDEEDKTTLETQQPHEVVEIKVPPGTDMTKVIMAKPVAPVDPALYEVESLMQDVLMAVGMQESNLGPASSETATAATIAEQSRLSSASSNVDDLDDLLSDLAKAGGEVLLREMSPGTVLRVAGPGAVWPGDNREDFVNEIYMEIMAASSGRPNKALEVSNFERLAPLLMQAGANPQFLVREGLKRLDDRLDPEEAFPLVMPGGGAFMLGANGPNPALGTPGGSQPTPPQPVQALPPAGGPVPLAAG